MSNLVKNDLKFIKDYTTVLSYGMNSNVGIEKVNDILLSSKYYNEYKVRMAITPDYKEAFLKFYEVEFEEKLQTAMIMIAEKNKLKNKCKM